MIYAPAEAENYLVLVTEVYNQFLNVLKLCAGKPFKIKYKTYARFLENGHKR